MCCKAVWKQWQHYRPSLQSHTRTEFDSRTDGIGLQCRNDDCTDCIESIPLEYKLNISAISKQWCQLTVIDTTTTHTHDHLEGWDGLAASRTHSSRAKQSVLEMAISVKKTRRRRQATLTLDNLACTESDWLW